MAHKDSCKILAWCIDADISVATCKSILSLSAAAVCWRAQSQGAAALRSRQGFHVPDTLIKQPASDRALRKPLKTLMQMCGTGLCHVHIGYT